MSILNAGEKPLISRCFFNGAFYRLLSFFPARSEKRPLSYQS